MMELTPQDGRWMMTSNRRCQRRKITGRVTRLTSIEDGADPSPSREEQSEGSSSTLARSASIGEVAAVVQSEQVHTYNTRSRARLLQNKT